MLSQDHADLSAVTYEHTGYNFSMGKDCGSDNTDTKCCLEHICLCVGCLRKNHLLSYSSV